MVAWTFAKAEGYFDVVEYNAANPQGEVTVPHSLGTEPGCVIIKCVNTTGTSWMVYHKSLGSNKYLLLNESNKEAVMDPFFLTATNTTITLFPATWSNTPGEIYIAYLFAEDTPDMIKCGSYTGNGSSSGQAIDVGFKPQWVLTKCSSSDNSRWTISDTKRVTNSLSDRLYPNDSREEGKGNDNSFGGTVELTPTGFEVTARSSGDAMLNGSGLNYIYVAIAEPPAARSLTQAEFAEQALKFATYQNRKEVNCGNMAEEKRDDLITSLANQGYDLADILRYM